MTNWEYYEDVDFSDKNIISYNIDSRDFYCKGQNIAEVEQGSSIVLDLLTINRTPEEEYYHTEQEVKDLIKRWWRESGGDGECRILRLESNDPSLSGWMLRYIEVFRTEKGFLICNRNGFVLTKTILKSPVDKSRLHHIAVKIFKR